MLVEAEESGLVARSNAGGQSQPVDLVWKDSGHWLTARSGRMRLPPQGSGWRKVFQAICAVRERADAFHTASRLRVGSGVYLLGSAGFLAPAASWSDLSTSKAIFSSS